MSSPWTRWRSRRCRRRPESTAIKLYGGGRWRRGSGRRRRSRASRDDSFGGEDEGDEAESLTVFDLRGAASFDGGEHIHGGGGGRQGAS